MAFKILIHVEAMDDIQQGIDYYNQQQKGLGIKFHAAVKRTFKEIKSSPFFQIRYDDVRCRLLNKYPYLMHFVVDEKAKIIFIYRLKHTSMNNEELKVKK